MFYIGLYRENKKETRWPRALMFGIQHHLVELYPVCSNYGPGLEMVQPRGSYVLHRLI